MPISLLLEMEIGYSSVFPKNIILNRARFLTIKLGISFCSITLFKIFFSVGVQNQCSHEWIVCLSRMKLAFTKLVCRKRIVVRLATEGGLNTASYNHDLSGVNLV
jgi:hypothetical protein